MANVYRVTRGETLNVDRKQGQPLRVNQGSVTITETGQNPVTIGVGQANKMYTPVSNERVEVVALESGTVVVT